MPSRVISSTLVVGKDDDLNVGIVEHVPPDRQKCCCRLNGWQGYIL